MKASTLFALFLCTFILSAPGLCAQVGNNNPTGPSGEFNGNVTTGCSYDPYTSNTKRAITDIVVAGAVGEYGLSYSRVYNSRTTWSYSHNWLITVDASGQHETYSVIFPDGRQETFSYAGPGTAYRAAAPGIRERMQPWTSTGGNSIVCYLLLPDGGKIEFSGTRDLMHCSECVPTDWYEFSLRASALIDPYGQKTTYSPLPGAGNFQITEPAGRWIKVFYIQWPQEGYGNVDFIQASDGREVHYIYETQYFGLPSLPYFVLTSVSHYNEPSLTSTYTYTLGNIGKQGYLLSTCDDPLYAGPMKKIAYTYENTGSPRVFGQIWNEKCATTGEAVSTLAVTGTDTRRETRGDGRQRTFTYADGYLVSWTDFKPAPYTSTVSQTYDSNKFVDSITDERHNTTNFTNNPLTGMVTEIKYPATPSDTTPATYTRNTVTYTYAGVGCDDPYNQDTENPYYVCRVKDEANNVTKYWRDNYKRVTQIDYPDGGYETFSYNERGQVLIHRLKTGGMESFTYDNVRYLLQEYRNPDTFGSSGNPTARYKYDALDRISGVTDVFGGYLDDPWHTTNYQYDARGQVTVTTLPYDPTDYVRHTLKKEYNLHEGTLYRVTDPLSHETAYFYDGYQRLRSMVTQLRSPGDPTSRITSVSYHRNQTNADDYTHTDANVTLLALPSTNIVQAFYDENYRKIAVKRSAANGSDDAATTSYGYDDAGNLAWMALPDEQPQHINYNKRSTWDHDERNRLMTVKDPLDHYTHYTYDPEGHQKTVTLSNGQVTTFQNYDPLNRFLQQTVKQTDQMSAVTKYTYTPGTGLHMTTQDPHLVAIGSNQVYDQEYDTMGRPKSLTYPTDYSGANRAEVYTYDAGGQLWFYKNRDDKIQTFSYDNLHRKTGFTWSQGSAPSVTFGYDAANRMTSITNVNAAISRTYFDDNSLKTETETAGGFANTVTYAWNADGNRESIQYPSLKKYRYNYTGRDQLRQVQDYFSNYPQAEYTYDVNGAVSTRKVGVNVAAFGVVTNASQRDALGQCPHLTHQFTGGGARTFDYVYDPTGTGNRTSIQRDGATAETYGYDYAQQAITGVEGGSAHTYGYDANGNRTALDGSGSYVTNLLNQQTTFNGQTVGYSNANGNVISAGSAASYSYDAQNRLTGTIVNGVTSAFTYDGLNRKISQTVAGTTTFNVWDGWNLIEERGTGNTLLNTYLYGAEEIVERITGATTYFYYQDGLGSTSHLSDAAGNLLEFYKYTTFGLAGVYASDGSVRKNGSSYDARHLFTGQLWMPKSTLYDYRDRVFSPSLTRFLQPDPIGFAGDPSNMYRYCGNNAVNRDDPLGLDGVSGSLVFVFKKPDNAMTGPDFMTGIGLMNDWGTFGEVMQYMGGGDHGTPDHFAGFGDLSGSGSYTGAFNPPLPVNPFAPINPLPSNPFTSTATLFPGTAGIVAGSVTTSDGLFGGTGVVSWILANPMVLAMTVPFLLTGDTAPKMATLYHYSAVHLTGSVWPGSYYTSIPGLTSAQASAGLGIYPPSYQYTVQVPYGTLIPSIVEPNRYGPGGLPQYLSPSAGLIIHTQHVAGGH